MVKLKTEISSYSGGKKGGRLTLLFDAEEAKEFERVLYNFRDKPLIIDIGVDAPARMEQLNQITEQQRKYIYQLFHDIGDCFGNSPEEIKSQLKEIYAHLEEIPAFSLSDCSQNIAAGFIDFLIIFAVENKVPLKENPIKHITDLEKYQLACIKNKVCCVCGKVAEIHHYDAIGISHKRGKPEDEVTLRKMALCRVHHTEAHTIGRETFCNKYHVTPVLVNG